MRQPLRLRSSPAARARPPKARTRREPRLVPVALVDVPPTRDVDRQDRLGRLGQLVQDRLERGAGGGLEGEACAGGRGGGGLRLPVPFPSEIALTREAGRGRDGPKTQSSTTSVFSIARRKATSWASGAIGKDDAPDEGGAMSGRPRFSHCFLRRCGAEGVFSECEPCIGREREGTERRTEKISPLDSCARERERVGEHRRTGLLARDEGAHLGVEDARRVPKVVCGRTRARVSLRRAARRGGERARSGPLD